MPDQNQDQQPQSNNSYGPLTSVLTDPLSISPNQALPRTPISGHMGVGGQLAMFADQFLRGAQQARRAKFERSEKAKAEKEANFDSIHRYVMSNPNISKEGKEAADQAYVRAKWGPVNEELGNIKDGHDNPLIHLAKAIGTAVGGPTEDKNHRDFGGGSSGKGKKKDQGDPNDAVHSLLSIANNPKYQVNPDKVASDTISGIADIIRQAQQGASGAPQEQPAQPPPQAGQPQDVSRETPPGALQAPPRRGAGPFMGQPAPAQAAPPGVPPQGAPPAQAQAQAAPQAAPPPYTAQGILTHPTVVQLLNAYQQKLGKSPFENPQILGMLRAAPETPSAKEQAETERYKAAAELDKSRQKDLIPVMYGVRGADGNTQWVRGAIDSHTNKPFDDQGNPIPAGDPRSSAQVIPMDKFGQYSGQSNRTHSQLKQQGDGTWASIDTTTGKVTPIMIDGKPFRGDTAMQRTAFIQSQENARHANTLDETAENHRATQAESLQKEHLDILAKRDKATDKKSKAEFDAQLKDNERRINVLAAGSGTPALPSRSKSGAKNKPAADGAAPKLTFQQQFEQDLLGGSGSGSGTPATPAPPASGKVLQYNPQTDKLE
jgi:hypothetical protein